MRAEIKNCWEHMRCGREPDGSRADDLGVCPAATAGRFDGVNGGRNAGRFCWFIVGTLCQGEIQGTFATKFKNCLKCPFYLQVEKEEGRHLILTEDDLEERAT